MERKWLYIYDYKYFDFKRLDEALHSENEKYCFKQYYGNSAKSLDEIKSRTYESLNKDDIIYVRFKNMPDNISRIVLKLIVLKTKDENGNFLYEQATNGYYYRYCLLGGKCKIKWINNKNDYKFCTNNLHKEYSIKTDYKYEITDNKKLIKDLAKNEYSYTEFKDKMKKLKTCEFKNVKPKCNHETFITSSGLPYREGHHFVHQSIYYNCKDKETKEKLTKLIYNEVNNILICPICHRKIHNGQTKDIEYMVSYLLKNIPGLKENTDKICKLLNKTFNELISEMYKINYKE